MKMNDHDSSNVISMINSTADNMKNDNDSRNVVSMIDSTLDGMEKSDNDLSDLVSMINSTIDNMKKNYDDPSNIVSMINADATSTQNDDDPNEEMTDIKGVSYNDNYIGTHATKYVCFNLFTTADVQQLLSSLQHSDSMPAMVEPNSMPTTVEIVLIPDCSSTYNNLGDSLHQNVLVSINLLWIDYKPCLVV